MQPVSFLTLIPMLKAQTLRFTYKTASMTHGMHTGYHKGFEDNLDQYRRYAQGDDLRYLDWKFYARTDKYYIREGFRRASQTVMIWLDASMSQRFTGLKYNAAWLSALSLAYLFRRQTDKVQMYLEGVRYNNENIVSVKSALDFIELNNFFLSDMKNLKKREYIPIENSLSIIKPYLKKMNKLLWINDLYIPIQEYKEVINAALTRKWRLSLIHLNVKDEATAVKRGFLNKIVDSETNNWLPSSRLQDYDKIWEDSVKYRIRLLTSRGFNYIQNDAKDSPLKILSKIKYL